MGTRPLHTGSANILRDTSMLKELGAFNLSLELKRNDSSFVIYYTA